LPQSLPDLAASLRSGVLELEEYLEALEEHFETTEAQVEAFCSESGRFERLVRQARELAERFPAPAGRPALFGVPIGVKDIFNVDGFETHAGSQVPAVELSGPEASSVTALRRAGALIMGKTVTTEFAFFAPGPTRNPVDPARTPGGSSSGSAAAVGAGLCPLTLGTQTIGSISRPASFCGVVGFKPTYGRTSRQGVIPLAPSLDHIGCFTSDVGGARLAAASLCLDWRPTPTVGRPRMAIPESPYLGRAARAGRERFRRACETLTEQGFEIANVLVMADFDAIERRHRLLVAGEAAQVHAQWLEPYGETYHAQTRRLIETGRGVSGDDLTRARAGRQALRHELAAAMDEHRVDLWLSPAAPDVAPLGLESTGDPVMNLPWTHAGLPTVSLPLPCADGELPFGLQLAGRWGADEELLAWADGLSRALAA
jgi:Asp-tRNA(Asn)/Glu-tRNA(Gln) amidotransferase A subunit family amidase